jgi:hypothetical protein
MTPVVPSLPPVQMLWIDGPLSTLERLAIASFLANSHAVHLYTYGEVPNVPPGALMLDANDVLPDGPRRRILQRGPGAGSWAFYANLFRYRLLHDRGGLWCDTDIVCLRPFTFAAELPRFFASERTRQAVGQGVLPVRANNCAMQAPARDPLLLELLERAEAMDGDQVPWGSAGPELLTRLVNERQLAGELLAPEVLCPIDYWNFTALLLGPQTIGMETHAVHFWNEMLRRNFFDKNANYDPLSLYERLKAHYLGRKEGEHAP